jgi:hypothetical protein
MMSFSKVAIPLIPLILGIDLVVALSFAVVKTKAQAPSPPTLYSIAINGQPISGTGPINFVNGSGLQFSAPAIVNGVTTVTAYATPTNLALAAVSISAPGVAYTASNMLLWTNYTPYQAFVLHVDVPTQAGASLNVDNLGPVMFEGTCQQVCWIVPNGSPVSAFTVH